jgi:hypothetical protein
LPELGPGLGRCCQVDGARGSEHQFGVLVDFAVQPVRRGDSRRNNELPLRFITAQPLARNRVPERRDRQSVPLPAGHNAEFYLIAAPLRRSSRLSASPLTHCRRAAVKTVAYCGGAARARERGLAFILLTFCGPHDDAVVGLFVQQRRWWRASGRGGSQSVRAAVKLQIGSCGIYCPSGRRSWVSAQP